MEAKLNNCSQANSEKCQNINGSFVCVCMDGYRRINATQQCKGKCACTVLLGKKVDFDHSLSHHECSREVLS